jgi:uncharacterized HhH-GPD family protein
MKTPLIVELGKKKYSESKKPSGPLSGDARVDELLHDLKRVPHVFVLGCLMDRQKKAEHAWAIPQRIFDELGTHDIGELAKISQDRFKRIFKEKKLHRFNDKMAEIFYLGVQDIINKYDGNAAKIWLGKPKSATVVRRFLEFKGCGIKIATMAANILARDYKIEFADYSSIDISPDTHVMRVMERMGYVSKGAGVYEVIYRARELNPELPGIIDPPCFEIGRSWCHARKSPDCGNCIISRECKKVI